MYLAYHSCPMTLLFSKKLGILVETSRPFTPKQCEGFFVKKRLHWSHQGTYCTKYTTAPSTPQHLHRSNTHQHLHRTTYSTAPTPPTYDTYTREPTLPLYCTLSYFFAWGGFGGGRRDAPRIVRVKTLSLRRRANFQARRRALSLTSACWSAGAWSVLRILFGIDDLLAVLGAWSVLVSLESTALSLYWARGSAGAWNSPWKRRLCRGFRGGSVDAWSILRIPFGIDALVAVFGRWERWRVERPAKSVWNLRPSLLSTVGWIYCQDSFFFASAILLARGHLPLAEEPVLHPDVRLLAASCGTVFHELG